MNKNNAADYLHLVQALAKGKTIQGRCLKFNGDFEWGDLSGEIDFRAPAFEYRIKPEPREIFMMRTESGRDFGAFESKEEAEKYGDGLIVRYREVIE